MIKNTITLHQVVIIHCSCRNTIKSKAEGCGLQLRNKVNNSNLHSFQAICAKLNVLLHDITK